MMLHRHFEEQKTENMTKLKDVSVSEEEPFVSEVFPPDEQAPKRGRKRKTENE